MTTSVHKWICCQRFSICWEFLCHRTSCTKESPCTLLKTQQSVGRFTSIHFSNLELFPETNLLLAIENPKTMLAKTHSARNFRFKTTVLEAPSRLRIQARLR